MGIQIITEQNTKIRRLHSNQIMHIKVTVSPNYDTDVTVNHLGDHQGIHLRDHQGMSLHCKLISLFESQPCEISFSAVLWTCSFHGARFERKSLLASVELLSCILPCN